MSKKTSAKNQKQYHDTEEYSGPKFTIRWKWLFGGMLFLALCCGAIAAIYFLRSGDRADFILDLVEQRIEKGDWREAITILDREHQANPKDQAILRQLADLLGAHAGGDGERNAAIQYYNTLLSMSNQEESIEILENILELHVKNTNQDLEKMIGSAHILLDRIPDNAIAWKALTLGRYYEFIRKTYHPIAKEPKFIDQTFEKALELNPHDIQLATAYASILRNLDTERNPYFSEKTLSKSMETRNAEADKTVAEMVAHHPEDKDARFSSLHYRQFFRLVSNPIQDDPDLQAILKIDPHDPDALTLLADGIAYSAFERLLERDREGFEQRRDEAIKKYQEVISYHPTHVAAYQRLASLYNDENDQELRIHTLETANKVTRQSDPELLISLLDALIDSGHVKKGREVLYFLLRHIDMMASNLAEQQLTLRRTALLFDARLDVIDNKSTAAITKFRQVFTPVIPDQLQPEVVLKAVISYTNVLTERMQFDLAADVFHEAVGYFEKQMQPGMTSDAPEFSRLEFAYVSEIDLWERIGQTSNVQLVVGRFMSLLENMCRINPDDIKARMSLATWQYQNNMAKSPESRNWTPLFENLKILKEAKNRLQAPWRVDFLGARAIWGRSNQSAESREESLVPLRVLENMNAANIMFLTQLMDEYLFYSSAEDVSRVMERIYNLPEGPAIVFIRDITRAIESGDTTLAEKIIAQALSELPEKSHQPFLNLQKSLQSGQDNFAILGSNSSQVAIDTVSDLYRQTLQELDRGDTAAAKEIEEKLRKAEGEEGSLWVLCRGFRLVQEATGPGDPRLNEAENLQKNLIGKRSNWDMAYLLDSAIQEKKENRTGMITASLQAIQLGNRNPNVYSELIYLLMQDGRNSEAERILNMANEMFPEQMAVPYVYFDMPFQVMYRDVVRSVARKDFAKAGQQAKDWLVLAKEKNMEEAAQETFIAEVGRAFMDAKQYDMARPYLEIIAKRGNMSVLPLAALTVRSGEMDAGYKMIIDAMNQDFDHFVDYLVSMMTMFLDYPPSNAVGETLDQALEKVDVSGLENPGALLTMVQYYVLRNQQDKALTFCEKLYELQPESASAANDYALLLAIGKKDFTKAHQIIDAALVKSPNSPTLLDTKGLIFLHADKPAEAVKWFEKATIHSVNSPLNVMHLAVAQLRNGDREKALKNYQNVKVFFATNREMYSSSNRMFLDELDKAAQ